MRRSHCLMIALATLVALLMLSGFRPYDRVTWLMEVLPIFIAVPILWASYNRFPLTNLLYFSIFVHAVVLMAGGHYTYARVPLGFDIAETLGLHRNPYDKLGHFFQGFVPALLAREILVRGKYVSGPRMLGFVVICIVLAVSAAYELIEWAAALALGQGADEFLGTQGDPWDTQSDMFMALLGALAALTSLSRIQDRQIARLESAAPPRLQSGQGAAGADGLSPLHRGTEQIPSDVPVDRLPGPDRRKWPPGYFRDEVVWSPSRTRFALAYSISEASMNNEIGCVLWGAVRESGTVILGNPAHLFASCWGIPWCVWLDDDIFVFKAQAGSGRTVRLPLVMMHVDKGFALVPNTDNLESWPDQVQRLPADIEWQDVRRLSGALQRGV